MIAILLGIFFTLLLLTEGLLLGVLASVHGPDVFPYFALAEAVFAVALLWIGYWWFRRRGYRHRGLLVGGTGVLLALTLLGALQVSVRALVDWEIAQQERIAAATQVLHMRDEPLLSAKGDPIGVRLRYSMRFPNNDFFWHTPSLRAGKDFGAGVWADGRFTEPTATPPLIPGKNTASRYEKGREYEFTADILPSFLVQNPDRTKLCILEPPAEYQAGFQRLLGGETMHYTISVNGTNFKGETANAYSPKVFYESARKEGAVTLPGSGFGGSIGRCE